MKGIIFILVIIISLASCNNEIKQPFLNQFQKEINAEVLSVKDYPNDSIGNPSYIFSFEKYIILVEPQMDNLLSLYNLENNTFQSTQKKGRGPNELIGISQINAINDSSFYVLDPFSNIIATYVITNDEIIAKYSKQTKEICNIFYDKTKSIHTQKGIHKYVFHDLSQNKIHSFGEPFKFPGYSSQITSNLDGVATVSFENNKIAWFSCCGDIFEIYDFNKSDSCKLIKRHIGLLPVIKKMKIKNNEAPLFLPKTKLGVYSIASNKDFIFILYNEHLIKDEITKKENAYLSDKILVYDWNGNPIKILKLNQKVSDISYNQSDDSFYCLSHNSNLETIIVKIKI